jgi:PII-like signaling protein
MLKPGPAKKVCIYVSEDQQYHGNSLYAAILDYLFYRGVAGATVIRGVAGFGADHHLHTSRILRLTENLPIRIEFIEDAARIDELLPKLQEMAGTGLIDIQDTTVLKPASEHSLEKESAGPPLKLQGKAKLMRIFIGESDRWHGKPLHQALVESLRANDIAGVTVYRGIMGYGANRRVRKDYPRGISHDAPIMLSAVDTEDKLRKFLPVLDDMMGAGLVVLSDVDIIKYSYDYAQHDRRKESR